MVVSIPMVVNHVHLRTSVSEHVCNIGDRTQKVPPRTPPPNKPHRCARTPVHTPARARGREGEDKERGQRKSEGSKLGTPYKDAYFTFHIQSRRSPHVLGLFRVRLGWVNGSHNHALHRFSPNTQKFG